jgi:hypothetical protein
MYEAHEMDLWRRRREGLLREAENERLARRLGAARQKRASSLGDALLRLAPGRLWSGYGRWAGAESAPGGDD